MTARSRLVPVTVSLTPDATQVKESDGPLRVQVTRRGDIGGPLTLYLQALNEVGTAADGTELGVPATVTIPAGQASTAFNVTPKTDGVVDGGQVVNIRGRFDMVDNNPDNVDADGRVLGLPTTTQAFEVLVRDVGKPTLKLAVPVSQLLEGGVVTATLKIDPVPLLDISVRLYLTDEFQLDMPRDVMVLAGAAETTFVIGATQDAYMEAFQTVKVRAESSGHAPAETTLGVIDDDLYGITVTLDSPAVSEADAYTKVRGTVTRTGPIDRKQWVDLVSSDPTAAKVQPSVLIPAGEASARFTIYVVDDLFVDGTQTTTITATPLDAVTGGKLTAAAGTASLQVLDDDASYLAVSFVDSIVREGRATIGRVTRHTGDLSQAVTVTLHSTDAGEATAPAIVTIEAAQVYAEFSVQAVSDGVSDGTQPVTIQAEASGYVQGAGWMYVTDKDLPDLAVSDLTQPGVYRLAVDPQGVEDLAGNPGGGVCSGGWTLRGDNVAPMVTGVVVQDGAAQRHSVTHLTVRFSEDTNVGELVAGGMLVGGASPALVLTSFGMDANSGPGTVVAWPVGSVFAWDAATYTLSWTAPAGAGLADGFYRLALKSAVVHDQAANPLAGGGAGGDFLYDLHRLRFDLDGDMIVDVQDRQIVDVAMGSLPGQPRWNALADLDGNAKVDIRDRMLLLNGYGVQVLGDLVPTVSGTMVQYGQTQRDRVNQLSVTLLGAGLVALLLGRRRRHAAA